jgi:hypothetical protein
MATAPTVSDAAVNTASVVDMPSFNFVDIRSLCISG